MTPLLLLDVDGVLNALPDSGADLACWTDWQNGWARTRGSRYHLTFSPSVVAQLLDWHETGLVEVQWLTTWGHDAPGELSELLGLPTFRVAGAPPASAGSAPDSLTGRWWKHDVVLALTREQPGRPLIWVDDALRPPSPFRTWAREHPDVTPVGPDPRSGLAPDDLEVVRQAAAPLAVLPGSSDGQRIRPEDVPGTHVAGGEAHGVPGTW